jgi:transmembrane protein
MTWNSMPPLVLGATFLVLLPFIVSGIGKLVNFNDARREVHALGLPASSLIAGAVIVLQLGASAAILGGVLTWLAAMALAGFTAVATLLAHGGWWKAGPAQAGQRATFFEHVAIIGGLCLIALHDLGWA